MALLDGMTCIVTGGASGIGRAVVDRFVAEGAIVGVLDLQGSPLEDLSASHPNSVIPVYGDVGDPESHERMVHRIMDLTGRIDTVVCCAGRFDFQRTLSGLSDDQICSAFDEVFHVNVLGSILAVRAAASELRRRRGSGILTSSSSAFYAEGAGVLYGASKWAIRGLVAHLSRELAPHVRVNGVAPGGTSQTRLHGLTALGQMYTVENISGRDERIARENLLGKALEPEDHVGAYLYLACPSLSRAVTGVTINSDGGRGAPPVELEANVYEGLLGMKTAD